MKEMGWHSFEKRREDKEFGEWLAKLRRGQGGVPSAAAALGC
jgi:hypothetical protein